MKQPFPPHRSLKNKIALATLAIFLVGIWSLSLYTTRVLREDMERQQVNQQLVTTSAAATQINNELDLRIRSLEVAANMLSHMKMKSVSALQTDTMTPLTPLLALFNGGIRIYDTHGSIVASLMMPHELGNIEYAASEVIAAAMENQETVIGPPTIIPGAENSFFVIAVPIQDDSGKILGTIGGTIDLDVTNFLDHVVKSYHGNNSYIIVAPEHRRVVTAIDRNFVMRPILPLEEEENTVFDFFALGNEGNTTMISPQGEELLISSKSIPLSGWRISAILSTKGVFAPIREMNERMMLTTMLVSLLAGILMWGILWRELSPLVDSSNMLANMARGDVHFHSLPIARKDEIGLLIAGFNHLLATLEQRETLLKQILDTSSVAIFLINMDGYITQVNRRMCDMFHCPMRILVGCKFTALISPSERNESHAVIQSLLENETGTLDLDQLYRRSDKTEFWGHLTGNNLYDNNDEKIGVVGVISDIDVRKRTEQRLQLIASVFTHAREGIVIADADGVVIDTNDSFTRITGHTREEVLGQTPQLLSTDQHPPEFYVALENELDDKDEWSGEVWNRRKNGELYAEMRTITAVRDQQGIIQCYVTLFSDITQTKEHEKQLERMAHFDMLTELPNRVLLVDRLHQAMAQAQRHRQLLAVAYLDLDGFKTVNDKYGHEIGDQLLVALAQRMKNILREGDTLARLGGDEFVAVLIDMKEGIVNISMASRLLDAAAQPVRIGNQDLQVSASLGITFYPQAENVDADQLLRQADQAMYQAKLSGKNRYHLFDAEQDRNVRGHHESLQRIQEALFANEFVLFFQPKVNMHTGQVVGAEALVRWQHPERGLLLPSVFLPVIENHALSTVIGEWVINTTLAERARWHSVGLDISVSVNIGAHQLQQKDFVNRLREILAKHPSVQPSDLELEVLETSALEDLARISKVVEECNKLGVRLALDDFGTGYSSLTYLKRLPVTTLKIDQSFVRDMLDDPDDLAILQGVISLASAFRREVIAEGVEAIEHGKLLLQLGCQLAQGYGIAKPMPGADLPEWVKTWRPDPEWLSTKSVNHDDLPLLFSRVEHRSWFLSTIKFLNHETNEMPPQDPGQCHLGKWLDSDTQQNRHAESPVFQCARELHAQIHQVSDVLCKNRLCNIPIEEVSDKLQEFHTLSDDLLSQVQLLSQS